MIVVAIILTVGISAFVSKQPDQQPKPFTLQWYDFTGTSSSQYGNVAFYTADPNHVNPCSGSGLRCEILAPIRTDTGHEGEPDLTAIDQETKKP